MMNRFNAPQFRFSSPFRRAAIASVLSALGVLMGVIPGYVAPSSTATSSDYSTQSAPALELGTLHFDTTAQAQQPPGNISLYTKVARQIEQQRLRYYSEVKQIMNGNVPDNVCLQRNLTPQVQEVCKRFNDDVYNILSSNNMDREEFKRLKSYCDASPKPGQCP